MFGIDYIPKITLKYLEENDSERAMGWWFGKHAGNSGLLNGHESVLVEHIANTPELCSLYTEEKPGESRNVRLLWRRSGIRLYRQFAQECFCKSWPFLSISAPVRRFVHPGFLLLCGTILSSSDTFSSASARCFSTL